MEATNLVDIANKMCLNTLIEHLGIEFTEVGIDYLCAKMPVDHRTFQPMGQLHGGATAALAESMGSLGSAMLVNHETDSIVGIELNANHIKSVNKGFVYGRAEIIHKGNSTHVWNINVRNEENQLVAVCRLTNLIIKKKVN
jgi:1,4-dihydroxy-2-naphthoyl-CoA hydrolase